jgi:hypothetical protein
MEIILTNNIDFLYIERAGFTNITMYSLYFGNNLSFLETYVEKTEFRDLTNITAGYFWDIARYLSDIKYINKLAEFYSSINDSNNISFINLNKSFINLNKSFIDRVNKKYLSTELFEIITSNKFYSNSMLDIPSEFRSLKVCLKFIKSEPEQIYHVPKHLKNNKEIINTYIFHTMENACRKYKFSKEISEQLKNLSI